MGTKGLGPRIDNFHELMLFCRCLSTLFDPTCACYSMSVLLSNSHLCVNTLAGEQDNEMVKAILVHFS